MAFKKKTWKDRLVEYAGRKKITNVSTLAAQIVDIERAEGVISEEGSAFDAANMNDFEQRVADGFAGIQQDVDGVISDLGALRNNSGKVIRSVSDTYASSAGQGTTRLKFTLPKDGTYLIIVSCACRSSHRLEVYGGLTGANDSDRTSGNIDHDTCVCTVALGESEVSAWVYTDLAVSVTLRNQIVRIS